MKKIKKVDNMAQVKMALNGFGHEIYVECEGKIYTTCFYCGEMIEVDDRRHTREELTKAMNYSGDEIRHFCGDLCKKRRAEFEITEETGVDFTFWQSLLARAKNEKSYFVDADEVREAYDCDHLSVNEARNGNKYLWYLDEDEINMVMDLQSGEILEDEDAKTFSEEQFA